MIKKLTSIIVPAHNSEATIARCIDSIIMQTFSNFEAIIIDDGSTDQTVEIIKSYQLKDSRIKLTQTRHCGVSAARNRGLECAQGEYIYFMDSDDTIEPYALQVMQQCLNKNNADIAIFNINFIYGKHAQRPLHLSDSTLNQEKFVSALIHDAQGYLPNKFYRRKTIDKTRFNTSIDVCEDFLFNLEISKNISKAIIENRYIYNYYQNKHSSTHQKYTQKQFTELQADRKILKVIQEQYPTLFLQYVLIILLSVYRQIYNYKKSGCKNPTFLHEFDTFIQVYEPKVLHSTEISIAQKIKVIYYKEFYGIIKIMKDIKHSIGVKS